MLAGGSDVNERLEKGGRDEVDRVWDHVHDPPWHTDEFRKAAMAAVGARRDAEHLTVGAEIFAAHLTVFAGAAEHGRVEGHAAAERQIIDVPAHRLHRAGGLMPHHEWRDTSA